MRSCPVGAVVPHSELATICDAVEKAIEFVEIEIASDHVVNPAFRTPETRATEQRQKKLLRQFQATHRQLDRLGATRPEIKLTEKGKAALRDRNCRA